MRNVNCHMLLADSGKGTSWLNMYKMTAKACEAIQPLPHNFAMPKVEPHPSDKTMLLVSIGNRWGREFAAKHLNKTCLKTQVASQYVVLAA